MSRRRSTLQDANLIGNRDVESRYDDIKEVAENLAEILEIIAKAEIATEAADRIESIVSEVETLLTGTGLDNLATKESLDNLASTVQELSDRVDNLGTQEPTPVPAVLGLFEGYETFNQYH